MTKILFICHGNICRSPMAEFVMKAMVKQAGLETDFVIASAAVSGEEQGNPVYPPVRRLLAAHGIDCDGKTARQLRRSDYGEYDELIAMDDSNLRAMRRICGGDPDAKMSRLADHGAHSGDIADPWYSGDFERTWREVNDGCAALLKKITLRGRR